jgi:hypothetical protein
MHVGSANFRRRSDKLWLLGATLVLVLLLLNIFRVAISEKLVPDARMNRNLERAHKALQRGELSRADGQGAMELYQEVLAIDPDQQEANAGLLAVRNAAIARVGVALRAHRLADARRDLQLARALDAPRVQVDPLDARLRALEEASVDVPGLLARAAAPGVGDEQALALLDQVLALDAGNALALEGRHELFSQWLLQAEHELDAGHIEQARVRIERVMAEDPGHVDLPPLRARLGELAERRERNAARELAHATELERAGSDEAAAEIYLQFASQDEDARAALARLAERAARQAASDAGEFRFARAQARLEQARRWHAEAPAIAAAERRLQQARATRARLPAAEAKKELARLPKLLAEARAAMAHGDLLTPPGSSAWDKLRVAAAIAPRSRELHAAQAEFVRRSRDCEAQALASGRLRRANACLAAWQAQDPVGEGLPAARRELALRWLAYAGERIGASDWKAAQAALAQARELDPANPQLRAAEQRLRRAQGK